VAVAVQVAVVDSKDSTVARVLLLLDIRFKEKLWDILQK